MSQRCYMCGLSFRLSSQNLFILEYKWIFEPNVKKEQKYPGPSNYHPAGL